MAVIISWWWGGIGNGSFITRYLIFVLMSRLYSHSLLNRWHHHSNHRSVYIAAYICIILCWIMCFVFVRYSIMQRKSNHDVLQSSIAAFFILICHKLFLDVWYDCIKHIMFTQYTWWKRAERQGIPMFWQHRLVQNCNPPVHYKRQLSLIAFFLCPVASALSMANTQTAQLGLGKRSKYK